MGGGGRVTNAVLYSVMADISSQETQTTLFYYLEVADYLTQLAGLGIASYLMMSRRIRPPFIVGIIVATLASLIVLCLPDTRRRRHQNIDSDESCGRNFGHAPAPGRGDPDQIEGVCKACPGGVW